MHSSIIVSSLLALAATTSALGVNCRGSALCINSVGKLKDLKDLVDGISDRDRTYSEGDQIACKGNLCTFFQNGASGNADDASSLLQDLIDHGCTVCGSMPTQDGNNVDDGELTANMVSSPSCKGACKRDVPAAVPGGRWGRNKKY